MRLNNKVAIVTGAGRGIGRATALLLAAEAAHVLRGGTNLAWTACLLADVAHDQGNDERATALLEESVTLFREVGDRWGVAVARGSCGTVAYAEAGPGQGDTRRALALYAESLVLRRELGDKYGLAECLEGLAGVGVVQRQLEGATQLLGAAAALREASGAPLPPSACARYDHHVSVVRAGLGEAAFAAVWATGKAMPLEQVITTAVGKRSEHHDHMGA